MLSEVVKVTINITLVNDKPIATAQTVEAVEQTAKTILAGTDAEGQDITYIIASLPSNGSLTDDGAITSDDLPKTTNRTDVVYTSTSDTATSDSFTFKVNDGTNDSEDAATVTINIEAVNDVGPVATAQTVDVEDVAKTITLAATDVDGDT